MWEKEEEMSQRIKLTEDTKIFDGVDSHEFPYEYKIKDIDEPVRKQILENQKIADKARAMKNYGDAVNLMEWIEKNDL